MKKVYQTIHGKGIGNCMDASIASLLEIDLNLVPHFNDSKDWFGAISDFVSNYGYKCFNIYNKEEAKLRISESYKTWYNDNKDEPNQLLDLEKYEGINGYFEAAVYSPKYYNEKDDSPAMHSVIIDNKFNIIHDPEIGYKNIKKYPKADELGFNGIIHVTIFEKIK